jgi:hypothetical protein
MVENGLAPIAGFMEVMQPEAHAVLWPADRLSGQAIMPVVLVPTAGDLPYGHPTAADEHVG